MNAFEIERVENGWVLKEHHDLTCEMIGPCVALTPARDTVHVFAAADTLVAHLTERMKAQEQP